MHFERKLWGITNKRIKLAQIIGDTTTHRQWNITARPQAYIAWHGKILIIIISNCNAPDFCTK